MSLDLASVAKEFSLTEEAVARESLRAFLLQQLHLLDTDRRARCAKFGVKTLEEMDELLRLGKVEEDAILADFQEVDYLSHRIGRVQEMLEEA